MVVVAACLGLGWWQLSRALGGNSLSWVYSFEWPFFAAYGIYMWWKLLHEPLSETRLPAAGQSRVIASPEGLSLAQRIDELGFDPYDESADPELAAYNRYLAGLHNADRVRSNTSPRRPRAT
ncbi:MAG: hypothetical protein ACYDBS_04435 [Acidimicrobiales bacterium]